MNCCELPGGSMVNNPANAGNTGDAGLQEV